MMIAKEEKPILIQVIQIFLLQGLCMIWKKMLQELMVLPHSSIGTPSTLLSRV